MTDRSQITPTPADLARDPLADLALCEALTARFPGRTYAGVVVYEQPGANGLTTVYYAGTPAHASCAQAHADAQFWQEARIGWPAALRRLIAAEAELARLRGKAPPVKETP